MAYVIVAGRGEPDRTVPIFGQLFVGRECAGISPQRALLLEDPQISRNHLEIRLDADTDRAFLIDTSTNGTKLNGRRLERAVPVPIRSGDLIGIGDLSLRFESDRFRSAQEFDPRLTRAHIGSAPMVMVVGDITNYSTIAEITDPSVIASSLDELWQELGRILRTHQGTLNHYAGDALYAVWELNTQSNGIELAIAFALAANQRVDELGPGLPLRDPQGSPLHMGWGVVVGVAALASMTRSVEAVIGDSTNVAFRLAGLAGRDERAPVMVTSTAREAVKDKFVWGDPEQVLLKGRQTTETVYPVIGPATSQTPSAPTDAELPVDHTIPPVDRS